ncbi:hypothetical protein D3C81_2246800 [compost metagenome]
MAFLAPKSSSLFVCRVNPAAGTLTTEEIYFYLAEVILDDLMGRIAVNLATPKH